MGYRAASPTGHKWLLFLVSCCPEVIMEGIERMNGYRRAM